MTSVSIFLFSVYSFSDVYAVLHILYMKSNSKSLSRNYNAENLELFCQNRFYGPLIVAYNLNRHPYYLHSFALDDLAQIATTNKELHNKCVKDDMVLECLLHAPHLNDNLNSIFKRMEPFTFYMFKYKSCWCPNRNQSHDSKSCIYAHHMRDFRRPPEIFKYSTEDCETMKNDKGWEQCPRGLLCNKCHTTVERLYHPDKYKRIYCDQNRCNKSEICAFFHKAQEKNEAQKQCNKFRKQVSNKKYSIQIEQINNELISHYQKKPSALLDDEVEEFKAIKYDSNYIIHENHFVEPEYEELLESQLKKPQVEFIDSSKTVSAEGKESKEAPDEEEEDLIIDVVNSEQDFTNFEQLREEYQKNKHKKTEYKSTRNKGPLNEKDSFSQSKFGKKQVSKSMKHNGMRDDPSNQSEVTSSILSSQPTHVAGLDSYEALFLTSTQFQAQNQHWNMMKQNAMGRFPVYNNQSFLEPNPPNPYVQQQILEQMQMQGQQPLPQYQIPPQFQGAFQRPNLNVQT